MNQEQAHHQPLKDALATLLKTPPDYWNIQEDFVMIGYYSLGIILVRGSRVDVSLIQSVILNDPLLAVDIRKLAQQAQAAHDPSTAPIASTTTAIHRFLKTL
jgi:hypothetical protein